MPRRFGSGFILLLVVFGCGRPEDPEPHRFTRFSMGTVVEYTVFAQDRDRARAAVDSAHQEMERVSSLLWEDDSSSVVYAFNAADERTVAPDEGLRFLERAKEVAAETGGAFDPTVKPVLDLYAFGSASPRPPSEADIAAALPSVGFRRFRTSGAGFVEKDLPQVALAVGGIAKGYAVDRAVDVLRRAGIRDAIVNAGGDLYCLGSRAGKPWRVGIRDPGDAAGVIVVLAVHDTAVATSGDYQQYYDYEGTRYHHILVPSSGTPARGLRSATVITSNTERADALATALFVLGASRGLDAIESMPGTEGLVIDSLGTLHQTSGMSRFLAENAGQER